MAQRHRHLLAGWLLGSMALVGILVADGARAAVLAALSGPLFLPLLLAVALVRPFVAWPLSLLSVAVGYRLGVPAGVPVALAVTVLTCLPPYLLAVRLETDRGLLGRIATAGRDTVAVTGRLRGTLAARLSPAPADAVSYGAGLAGVSLPVFLAGTLVGEVPWAVAYVLVGASLEALASDGGVAPPLLLVVGCALAALALLAGPLLGTVTGE